MGKTTLEAKTDELTQGSNRRVKTKSTNILTANGTDLECSSCGPLRIEAYQLPKEEKPSSKFYHRIKTKLTEIYHGLKIRLMDITRYTPK